MLLKKIISNYWRSLIVISGILYLSFAPPSTFKGVPSFQNEDKLVHLFLYAGLTCILIFDYLQYFKNKEKSKISFVVICLLLPVFLGGVVEILQPMYFAPRTAEWLDWFSDISGMLVGWLAIKLVFPKWLRGL